MLTTVYTAGTTIDLWDFGSFCLLIRFLGQPLSAAPRRNHTSRCANSEALIMLTNSFDVDQ